MRNQKGKQVNVFTDNFLGAYFITSAARTFSLHFSSSQKQKKVHFDFKTPNRIVLKIKQNGFQAKTSRAASPLYAISSLKEQAASLLSNVEPHNRLNNNSIAKVPFIRQPNTFPELKDSITNLLSIDANNANEHPHAKEASKEYHRKLIQRWMETSAFTPHFEKVMKIKKEPIAPASLEKWSTLNEALQNYFSQIFKQTQEAKVPFFRALFLQYPADKNTYRIQNQFLVGDTLLVLPTLRKDASNRRFYLPAGTWEHPVGIIHTGPGFFTIATPSNCPAVFLNMKSKYYQQLRDSLRTPYLEVCTIGK